jgi:hypothetical protein
MSDENPDDLITMVSHGWEKLSDGAWQLLIECPTIVHYITLPKTLCMGCRSAYKAGWDSDRKVALYRDTPVDMSGFGQDGIQQSGAE